MLLGKVISPVFIKPLIPYSIGAVVRKFFINSSDDKYTLIAKISRTMQLKHSNLCRYFNATLLQSASIYGEIEKAEIE